MIFSRVQVRHFRSLANIDQPLGRFGALVGPNASGKTTFLDVFNLLRDLMHLRGDVQEAVAGLGPSNSGQEDQRISRQGMKSPAGRSAWKE